MRSLKLYQCTIQIVIALSFCHPLALHSNRTDPFIKIWCGKWAKRIHSRKEIGKSKHINAGFIAIFTDKWNCRFVLLLESCAFCDHSFRLLWIVSPKRSHEQECAREKKHAKLTGNIWFNGRQLFAAAKVWAPTKHFTNSTIEHPFMLILYERKTILSSTDFTYNLPGENAGQICVSFFYAPANE